MLLHLRLPSIAKIIGMVLMLFSLSMLPPMIVALLYSEMHMLQLFVASFLLAFVIGFVTWLGCHRDTLPLRVRDGCLVAVLFWLELHATCT